MKPQSLNIGFCIVALAAAVPSGGPAIEHAPVGCVKPRLHPIFEARLTPADTVARARVYFRAKGGPHWYFVEMKRAGAVFTGTLPQPRRDTPQIEYYIEVVDQSFTESRTEEFHPAVSSGPCGPGQLLAAVKPAAIILVQGGALGAPLTPVGFLSNGIVGVAAASGASGVASGAAGAGSAGAVGAAAASNSLLVAGAVAVAAGAGAAVIATSSGHEAARPQPSPSPNPLSSPSPPASPSAPAPPTTVTGRWQGGASVVRTVPGDPDCSTEVELVLDLVQSGSLVSGQGQSTVTRSTTDPVNPCGMAGDVNPGVVANGAVSGNGISMTVLVGDPGETIPFALSGAVSGDRMSGTLTASNSAGPRGLETFSGTWVLTRP